MDEVDHIFAERRSVNSVGVVAILIVGVLCLYFLHNLFAKGADFGGAGDDHVLRTLILTGDTIKRAAFVLDVGVQVSPEFDKEEGI